MFTTHYTSPTSEMNVRDYDDSILFGSTPLTIVLTKVEALDVIIGMMPFLDDDALSKIALQRIALDDERHPRPDETHVGYPHYPGIWLPSEIRERYVRIGNGGH